MSKKTRGGGWASAATGAGKDLHESDQLVHNARDAERATGSASMQLSDILNREGDTRPADPGHVLNLAESISALGLLEPLVVDRSGRLLAGLHRREACRLLLLAADDRTAFWNSLLELAGRKTATNTDRTRLSKLVPGTLEETNGRVPVRQINFDASKDATKALAIEIAENEQRRDYNRTEILAIKERLEDAGYDFSKGRPKKGAKPGLPALQAVIGKSHSTVKRILTTAKKENSSHELFSELTAKTITRTTSKWCAQLSDADHRRTEAMELANKLAELIRRD